MPEPLAAVCFAASDPPQRCGSFRDRSLAQRQHRGPENLLLINKSKTCASLVYPGQPPGAASNLLNTRTHFGDSRVIASPRRKQPSNSGWPRAEAEVWDAASASA